jgi:hypothetical protein
MCTEDLTEKAGVFQGLVKVFWLVADSIRMGIGMVALLRGLMRHRPSDPRLYLAVAMTAACVACRGEIDSHHQMRTGASVPAEETPDEAGGRTTTTALEDDAGFSVRAENATEGFTWTAPAASKLEGVRVMLATGAVAASTLTLNVKFGALSGCANSLDISGDAELIQPVAIELPRSLIEAAGASAVFLLRTKAGDTSLRTSTGADGSVSVQLAEWGRLAWGQRSCPALAAKPEAEDEAPAVVLTPPAEPVFEHPVSAAYRRTGTARVGGQAEAGSVVAIYAGTACEGTALATVTAAEFAAGVDVAAGAELAHAAFSAVARKAGASSDCAVAPYTDTALAFVWEGGPDRLPYSSSYGTVGVAAASNWPAKRGGSGAWSDGQQTVWIFGGNSSGWGDVNDFWKYDLATKEWTWLSGDSTSPGVGSMGTLGVEAPGNSPPPRAAQQTWMGLDGNLYMYGGYSQTCAVGRRGDMWKYNRTTSRWVWISGSTACNTAPVYGTKGVADAANTPGGWFSAKTWTGADGRFWMFGASENRNDLWVFDPGTLLWTWMGGSGLTQQNGVYGTKGVAAATNWPGTRENACGAVRSDGKVYVHGGSGHGETGGAGLLADLWLVDTGAAVRWTWLSGSKAVNAAGVLDAVGGDDTTRMPGGRRGASCWVDGLDRLWMFGGTGYDDSGDNVSRDLSDLWMYDPVAGVWTFVAGASAGAGQGVTTAVGEVGFVAWPGARADVSVLPVAGGRVWFFGGSGYTAGNAARSMLNDIWSLAVPGR